METTQPSATARKSPISKATDIVIASPVQIRTTRGNGWRWEWNNNYNEIDGRIEAPCWLELWDDDTLKGYMSNCKNAGNPFTLAFWFEIKVDGFSYGWRTCTRDFLEGGSASIDTTASYHMFGGRPANRDITY